MDVRWEQSEYREPRQPGVTHYMTKCEVTFRTALEWQIVFRVAGRPEINAEIDGKDTVAHVAYKAAHGSHYNRDLTGEQARQLVQEQIIDVWQRILDEQQPLILVAEMLADAMNSIIDRQRKEIEELEGKVRALEGVTYAVSYENDFDQVRKRLGDLAERVEHLANRHAAMRSNVADRLNALDAQAGQSTGLDGDTIIRDCVEQIQHYARQIEAVAGNGQS